MSCHSAQLAALVHRGKEFGISVGAIDVGMNGICERKRKMIADLIAIHRDNYATSGTELIMGNDRFIAPKIIEVTGPDGDPGSLPAIVFI
jgi:pyruvate/2-oxoglutarate dehydrogenase complex dihydrolipoamide dehydrogenase (E3) component